MAFVLDTESEDAVYASRNGYRGENGRAATERGDFGGEEGKCGDPEDYSEHVEA
jgi:hypothetical protein